MEQFHLPTPEAIDIEYDIAGIGTRFLAACLDSLAAGGLLVVVVLGAVAIGHFGGWAMTAGLIIGATLAFLLIWGYYIVFETLWRGQTPGKRALHIRVIKTTGYPTGLSEAVIRNLIRYVDFLPGFYGLGVVVMFASSQSRRLGDYAAGTLVVKERAPDGRPVLDKTGFMASSGTGLVPPAGSLDPDELEWDVKDLRPDDLAVVREFLARAPELPLEVRARIGGDIARRVCERIGAREPLDPVAFLDRVVGLKERER
ncbi:MAG: RDD family protein [Chloroflexota bacterium]